MWYNVQLVNQKSGMLLFKPCPPLAGVQGVDWISPSIQLPIPEAAMIQRNCVVFTVSAILFLIVFSIPSLIASHENSNKQSFKSSIPQSTIQNLSSTSTGDPKLDSAAFAQKTKKLQIPFIANNGQVDEQVKFYANTFGGTVFVTKDGEIVYALPNNSSESGVRCSKNQEAKCMIQGPRNMSNTTNRLSCILHHEANIPYCTNCLLAGIAKNIGQDTQGVAIKETLVGGRVHEITGNEKAVTKVSYFKGNDTSQWKTNISAYDVVSLGEVYDGIELKLKAYGNNVEKLFCVKPDANPDQIQVKLSGAKDLRVNDEGQLEAETELGMVKFTKPIAYQEIDGNRVAVDVEYDIQNPEVGRRNQKIPNWKSASYNKTRTKKFVHSTHKHNPNSEIKIQNWYGSKSPLTTKHMN
ncbi:MAG: hypothetical protein HS127_06920 [Planctomycetia bacterium]|nr:hypothetical protein [Planctomycetia bacterium]